MNPKVLRKIGYGVYVVSSTKSGDFNGQISNTVFQVTSEPVKITSSVNKENFTHGFIKNSQVFSVSILSKNTPLKFIGNFGFKSGRDIDKFEGVNYRVGKTGAPIVTDYAVAYLDVGVTREFDVGSHTLFVGKVGDAEFLTEGEPMTYDFYRRKKKGITPEAPPNHIKKEGEKTPKYRCLVCGYIYDPERGDSKSGIEPNTPFEELPEDWVCPVCGATKDQFEKVE